MDNYVKRYGAKQKKMEGVCSNMLLIQKLLSGMTGSQNWLGKCFQALAMHHFVMFSAILI